jgi:hypothetical protein
MQCGTSCWRIAANLTSAPWRSPRRRMPQPDCAAYEAICGASQ